eukprot:gene46456-56889_t
MEVPSLRPEIGYELLKLIMLRESYLQRLDKILIKQNGKVDFSVIGIFDVLRELSIQIVELIYEWERAQVSYPNITQFTWNGKDYLYKVYEDMSVFSKYLDIEDWLGFSLYKNPFIVPLDVILDRSIEIADDAFLVFAQTPETQKAAAKSKAKTFTKSPYTTPIINDPQVFTQLSAKNKLNRKFQKAGSKKTDNSDNIYNPFLCYIPAELLKKIHNCYHRILTRVKSIDAKRTKEKAVGILSILEKDTPRDDHVAEEQSKMMQHENLNAISLPFNIDEELDDEQKT